MHLSVDRVAHSFPGTGKLFEDLTFEARPGDLVGLTGPSGSGKSTLLSLLAGWESPRTGTVERYGIEKVGWVFQNPHGSPRRTALDHVVLPLLGRGLRRPQANRAAMEIMSRFELERLAWRCFGALSGGEAQRLMLARAVAKAPDLLLVDEPTAQLDRVAARTVNDVLANIGGKQGIVVVATHDSDTAAVCPIRIDLGDWAPGARRPGRGNHRAGQMRGTSETTSAAGTEL